MILRIALFFAASVAGVSSLYAADRPNILWLSTEDMSPHLGCYGDKEARTPNIDRLAAEGIRFKNAFVPTPVCATCRSAIITGVYSASLGTHGMRSRIEIPAEVRCFPEYLRKAGYYCTNNEKQDYNFQTPAGSWDESSFNASWENRPAKSTPFFAVFNFTGTHESSTRGEEPKYSQVTSKLAAADRHDPAKLTLPPYYPDTPKVREHWARYYNVISSLDLWVAEHLAKLDEAGLADDTIVFFWSDHGAGIPRHKRWLYDTGMRVPLIVYVPPKWRHLVSCTPGEQRDQLVSLVDLGPTVLNLAGLKVPAYMQGQPFLGPNLPEPRKYVYGARDRMDESYDMFRAVRDGRFKYIRNYMPQRPYSQSSSYADNSDIMREIRRLNAEGKLNPEQALFMRDEKPREELYDLAADPFELNNLADKPDHDATRMELAAALDAWMLSIRDLGIVPEGMLMRAVPANGTRYSLFRGDGGKEQYAKLAKLARDGDLPTDLVAGAELDDSIRVIKLERALSDAELADEQREETLAALIDLYQNGDSPWDQVAAAGVLDLHIAGSPQTKQLVAANDVVRQQLSGPRGKRQPADSLRPWINRFDKRFSDGSAAAADESNNQKQDKKSKQARRAKRAEKAASK